MIFVAALYSVENSIHNWNETKTKLFRFHFNCADSLTPVHRTKKKPGFYLPRQQWWYLLNRFSVLPGWVIVAPVHGV